MAAHEAPPSLGFSRQEHWSGLPPPSPMYESERWKWSRSVVSDSSRPHGLHPTRLLRPWDFPGKSTGVGCHCLLQNVPLVTHKRMWMTFVTTSKNHGGNKMTMSTSWAMLKQSINGFKDFISLFLPLFCLFYPKLICIRGRTTFSEGKNVLFLLHDRGNKWEWLEKWSVILDQ